MEGFAQKILVILVRNLWQGIPNIVAPKTPLMKNLAIQLVKTAKGLFQLLYFLQPSKLEISENDINRRAYAMLALKHPETWIDIQGQEKSPVPY